MKKSDGPTITVLKNLISIDRTSGIPVYLQIAKGLIHGLRRGQLSKGTKLPGTDSFAAVLGVNRKTLQAAYDELMAQGWIDIFPRRGAFIAADMPERIPKSVHAGGRTKPYSGKTSFLFDDLPHKPFPEPMTVNPRNLVLDGGLPDVRLAPVAELIREYRSLVGRRTFMQLLKYGDPAGSGELIEMLAEFLRETRSLPISTENIMITRGAQMAFYLSARLLIKPGDHVAVGNPGYAIFEVMLRRLGAAIDRIPVDDFGIDTEFLDSICGKSAPRIVYVLPHHHYPTNATLAPERRIHLLAQALKYRFAIIEDDFDYDFEYESGPFLPIASLDDHGSVIYVGTLAKTLFPSLRVGFLVAPSNFIRAAEQMRRSIDLQGDTIMEAAIAELYRNGTMRAHIRKAVKAYRERRDNMCTLLAEVLGERVIFDVPTGGMGIWARFPGIDHDRVARTAYPRGLTISDRMILNPGTDRSDWARIGFASLTPSEQERAVGILNDALTEVSRGTKRGLR